MNSAEAANQGRKYKSRKERPCDACRRRKVCCIREPGDAACSLCRMQKSSCTYDNAPTPRRRRPAQRDDAAKDSDGHTALPLRASSTHQSHDVTPETAFHHDSTPKSGVSAIAPPVGEWVSQFIGISADQDPYVLQHCNFGPSNYYKSGDWACLKVRSDGVLPSHFSLVPESHLDAKPSYYPSTRLLDAAFAVHKELLTSYFDIIHTSFPLLDPARFTKGFKVELPLLAAMYCLAQPFCTAASEVSTLPIHSFVYQAMPIEHKSPRLETIEAALLFLQRHNRKHRAPPLPGVYPEIGGLIGMCHDAGLNLDPSEWDLSASDRSRRKRIWWAAYIQDKWMALGLGRPSYIHEQDCNVPLPTLDDISLTTVAGPQLPQTSVLMFVAMAALTQILSHILTNFYTLTSLDNLTRLSVDEIDGWLHYWEDRLATFDDQYLTPLRNVNDIFLDPTGTLFLAYHTVEIVLYRAILRSVPPADPRCGRVRARAKQVVQSVSTLLENLQVTRLRAFWWSPISRNNFAMAGGFMFSMLLTSVTDAEIDYWSAEIARYRRLLDMQSLSFDTTKLASARMGLLATVSHSGRPASAHGRVDPKQAFCRDFGVKLNSI